MSDEIKWVPPAGMSPMTISDDSKRRAKDYLITKVAERIMSDTNTCISEAFEIADGFLFGDGSNLDDDWENWNIFGVNNACYTIVEALKMMEAEDEEDEDDID
jgi:hypothetical protein